MSGESEVVAENGTGECEAETASEASAKTASFVSLKTKKPVAREKQRVPQPQGVVIVTGPSLTKVGSEASLSGLKKPASVSTEKMEPISSGPSGLQTDAPLSAATSVASELRAASPKQHSLYNADGTRKSNITGVYYDKLGYIVPSPQVKLWTSIFAASSMAAMGTLIRVAIVHTKDAHQLIIRTTLVNSVGCLLLGFVKGVAPLPEVLPKPYKPKNRSAVQPIAKPNEDAQQVDMDNAAFAEEYFEEESAVMSAMADHKFGGGGVPLPFLITDGLVRIALETSLCGSITTFSSYNWEVCSKLLKPGGGQPNWTLFFTGIILTFSLCFFSFALGKYFLPQTLAAFYYWTVELLAFVSEKLGLAAEDSEPDFGRRGTLSLLNRGAISAAVAADSGETSPPRVRYVRQKDKNGVVYYIVDRQPDTGFALMAAIGHAADGEHRKDCGDCEAAAGNRVLAKRTLSFGGEWLAEKHLQHSAMAATTSAAVRKHSRGFGALSQWCELFVLLWVASTLLSFLIDDRLWLACLLAPFGAALRFYLQCALNQTSAASSQMVRKIGEDFEDENADICTRVCCKFVIPHTDEMFDLRTIGFVETPKSFLWKTRAIIPKGTVAANVFGTLLITVVLTLFSRKHSDETKDESLLVEGVVTGFCACLTTVSTFVAELDLIASGYLTYPKSTQESNDENDANECSVALRRALHAAAYWLFTVAMGLTVCLSVLALYISGK